MLSKIRMGISLVLARPLVQVLLVRRIYFDPNGLFLDVQIKPKMKSKWHSSQAHIDTEIDNEGDIIYLSVTHAIVVDFGSNTEAKLNEK